MENFEKIIMQLSSAHLDFAASTVAFLECQGKSVSAEDIEQKVPEEKLQFFKDRLQHYRSIYRPQQNH